MLKAQGSVTQQLSDLCLKVLDTLALCLSNLVPRSWLCFMHHIIWSTVYFFYGGQWLADWNLWTWVTYQNLALVKIRWLISWRVEGRGSNSQLKDSSSSIPWEQGEAGQAAGPQRDADLAALLPCLLLCPRQWLRALCCSWPSGTLLAQRWLGQLPASPEMRLGCLRAFIYFA